MSIQYLLVTFSEERGVLANGVMVVHNDSDFELIARVHPLQQKRV